MSPLLLMFAGFWAAAGQGWGQELRGGARQQLDDHADDRVVLGAEADAPKARQSKLRADRGRGLCAGSRAYGRVLVGLEAWGETRLHVLGTDLGFCSQSRPPPLPPGSNLALLAQVAVQALLTMSTPRCLEEPHARPAPASSMQAGTMAGQTKRRWQAWGRAHSGRLEVWRRLVDSLPACGYALVRRAHHPSRD